MRSDSVVPTQSGRGMWKIGLVILILSIMVLGYGGLCERGGHGDTTSGSSGTVSWPGTRQLGTDVDDQANGVATDTNNNIYVAGYTEGDLGDVITNTGASDLFVIKYNPGGEKQWARQLGTTSLDQAQGMATDTTDNIYVAGYTEGDLGDVITNAGLSDLFVIKYDKAGVKQWARQLGTTADDEATGVATDTKDNIYVVGYTNGDLGDVITNTGGSDLFVVKYNPAGEKQWARQLGTVNNDQAWAVATDTSDHIYVAGFTWGDLGDVITNTGGYDLFVVKYNDAGEKQWARQLGTVDNDQAWAVATDTSDHIYVAGFTWGDLGDVITNTGGYDLFVVKYNDAGEKQWARQLGTANNDRAKGVATDTSDNVYVTGFTEGVISSTSPTGLKDLFVVKYNPAGGKQWTRQLGTTADDEAYGVATDTRDNIYVIGGTTGNLDGNPNAGVYDLFVVKYNSAGVKQ